MDRLVSHDDISTHGKKKENPTKKKKTRGKCNFGPLSAASPPHDKYYSASLPFLSPSFTVLTALHISAAAASPPAMTMQKKKAFRPGKKNASAAAN